MKQILALLLLPVLLTACSLFGVRSGYEQPPYSVIDRPDESLEVRRYEARLAAEARVTEAEEGDGRNAAFRILFDYITGENRERTKISMTAPVEEGVEASREIAMTVPVETSGAEAGDVSMRFFLPAEFDAETAPEPTDPRVSIMTLPEQNLAVLRFSGSRDAARVEAKKEQLLQALRGTSWIVQSDPVALFYDPPWTLPFLRRSEVAVAVVRQAS